MPGMSDTSGIATITTPPVERHWLRKTIVALVLLAIVGAVGYEYHKHSHSASATDHGQASPNGYRTPVNTVIFYLDQQHAAPSPGNIARIKSVTCPQDIAAGKLSPISGGITSFKVTNRASSLDHAHVDTKLVTASDKAGTQVVVPLVKDGGKWLVCFTSSVATGGTLPSTPLPASGSTSA